MGKHFFKSLKIENFRGIRSCEINDFARINLFIGRNSCGKTTVLESFFLLTGISNPNLTVKIQNLRGTALSEPNDIKDFFFGQKEENGMHLIGTQESTERRLAISPYYGDPSVEQINGNKKKPGSRTEFAESRLDSNLSGLEYKFSVPTKAWLKSNKGRPKTRDYTSRVTLDWNSEIRPIPPQPYIDKKYKEKIAGRFITPVGSNRYDPLSVDKMIEEKRKSILLEGVGIIEPDIQDIKVGPSGVVSVDIGYERFIPLNLLGDGPLNIVNTISALDSVSGGILIIDEVGAGLHVSCIKDFWKILIQQSGKYDVQIFLTTHSKDVVEGLANFYKEENLLIPEDESPVACFHLKKNKEGRVKGYKYTPEQLTDVLEVGMDIRQ